MTRTRLRSRYRLRVSHGNEMLSTLPVLGVVAYLSNPVGGPGCRRLQIVAQELSREVLVGVQQQNVGAMDDGKNRDRAVDCNCVALYTAYYADGTRVLSRPVLFKTMCVMGDPLKIEKTQL